MEVPLGTEWNTRLGFQRATLPKVVTKVRFADSISLFVERLLTVNIADGQAHHTTGEACMSMDSLVCIAHIVVVLVHHLSALHTVAFPFMSP